jgi:hypothetical protein
MAEASDPFSTSEIFDEKFLLAVGRATVAWAYLEAGIDFAVLVIHGRLSGEHDPKSRLPRVLAKKLKYLCDAAQHVPTIADHSQRIQSVVAAIRREAVTRHDLVHGVATARLEETGELQMYRLLNTGTIPVGDRRFEMSEPIVMAHVARTLDLAKGILFIARDLFTIVVPPGKGLGPVNVGRI